MIQPNVEIFETPRTGIKPEDCFFYHFCDIPGIGTVGEHWDLRDSVEDYLGRLDYSGKTVLDIGTASGYLTFEMEKRGASVVSFDVLDETLTEIVPFCNDPLTKEELYSYQRIGFERLKNSYWFCHEHFKSNAKVYYGNIYQLPSVLGEFDIVMIGMCLPHIRDQFGALESITNRAKDIVVITQASIPREEPILMSLPIAGEENFEHLRFAWYLPSDGWLKNTMGILGFELQDLYRAPHKCPVLNKVDECATFIFKRHKKAR